MKDIFTTYEIAQLCTVDITTVINWINSKKLQAYKTPGGHRRIRRNELVKFLKKYDFPIPREIESNALSILVVDDDADVRIFIKNALTKTWPNVNLFEAEDGFAAGKLVAEKHPHVVILDIKLPGIDGIQVCQLIRKDNSLKSTKIIAFTGYFSPALKQNMLKAGADEFMVKPISVERLIRNITKLLK